MGISKVIDKDQLVVLLGAGASNPGMLSTSDVTKILLGWEEFRIPPCPNSNLDLGPSLLRPALDGPDSRPAFFQGLYEVISSEMEDREWLNFEHLMHVAEQLGSIFPSDNFDHLGGRNAFLPGALLSINEEFRDWAISGSSYWVLASKAAFQILDWFKERCDIVSTPSHPQALGIRKLADSGLQLRAFSLNYDDIPFESGLEFYTGFTKEGQFQPEYPWPLKGHTLCQLHGSVRFGMDGQEIVNCPNRKIAQERRRTHSSVQPFQDGHWGTEAPMITGLRKADKVMTRPFGTYMHVLREELLSCPRWLIVGYGFGDLHINQAMIQARANWLQRGVEVRVVIIDWFPPQEGNTSIPAWMGYPAGDKIRKILEPVFQSELKNFIETPSPYLSGDHFVEVSGAVALDLAGAKHAFECIQERSLSFLNR